MRATTMSTIGFASLNWMPSSAFAGDQLKDGTADTANSIGLVISLTQALLLVSTLGACIACIYMVFFFGRRLQTSAYFRESLISAAKQEELRNLLRELDEKRRLGPLDESTPPPEGFEYLARSIWHDSDVGMAASAPDYSYGPPDETDEQKKQREAEVEKRKKAEEERLVPFRAWAKEERARYSKARQEAEAEAQRRAEKKVPASIDISLLGGGWSFLLEFSTVIVIIFVLLCLGLLGTVSGKDIIAVLAAIAGYVLGKASSVAQKAPEKEQPSHQ
jgi:hypothetical protein